MTGFWERVAQALGGWAVDATPAAPAPPPKPPIPVLTAAETSRQAVPVVPPKPGSDRFSLCLTEVLRHEGGWSDHPRDPGGATNMGITLATFRDWRAGAPTTKDDLRAISRETVGAIYRKRYWEPLACDDLPPGLDLAAFDFGVNSGTGRSARFLQHLVAVKEDGQVGPATLAAVRGFPARHLVNRLCDDRLAFLRALPTWDTFGKGWARRVEEVRAKALAAT